jgi:deoxyribodipyrimidine photo-lyase
MRCRAPTGASSSSATAWLELDAELRARSRTVTARLLVRHGRRARSCRGWPQNSRVQAVYANHDDEPAALRARRRVRGRSPTRHRAAHRKDHVVFERSEVLTRRRATASSRRTRTRG